MKQKHNLVDAIRARGGRLTRQRQLIMEILEENAEQVPSEHLNVEALYEQARIRDQRIGIATVYRTLTYLKELGLVDEHRFGEDHSFFEAVRDGQPHYHFTCTNCGQVSEFEAPQVMEMARLLCESRGLQVAEVHLHFSGLCAQCRPAGTECE